MHLIIQNLEVKIYIVKEFKIHKIKNLSNMFRIVCDPSSGSIELYLTEIVRSGSQMFVVCLVGVWQRNFEPVVCVCVQYSGLSQTGELTLMFFMHIMDSYYIGSTIVSYHLWAHKFL